MLQPEEKAFYVNHGYARLFIFSLPVFIHKINTHIFYDAISSVCIEHRKKNTHTYKKRRVALENAINLKIGKQVHLKVLS